MIWVFGLGDHEVLAFTDFGIENLVERIKIDKEMKSSEERRYDAPMAQGLCLPLNPSAALITELLYDIANGITKEVAA